jgi:hypothetical protein
MTVSGGLINKEERLMKWIFKTIFLMMISSYLWAQDFPPSPPPPPPPPILDKIAFQISAKQWVNTQTALVGVSINATLSNADLVKVRADILSSLSKIAKGDWHLLSFDRSQDGSGLEKLFVQAQARVDQSALTDIYQQAQSVSKPGAQYRVTSVEFKPSLDETQVVRARIRAELYQKVNEEMDRMNKAYPTQKYSLSNLMFSESDNGSLQPPMPYAAKTLNALVMPAPLSVSNELIITAIAEAASNRLPGN